jgi:hypothetical protein
LDLCLLRQLLFSRVATLDIAKFSRLYSRTISPALLPGFQVNTFEISLDLSAMESLLNVAFKFVPSASTVATIATAIAHCEKHIRSPLRPQRIPPVSR